MDGFDPWAWPTTTFYLLELFAVTRLTPITCPYVDLLLLSIYCWSQPLLFSGENGPPYIAGRFDLWPTETPWAGFYYHPYPDGSTPSYASGTCPSTVLDRLSSVFPPAYCYWIGYCPPPCEIAWWVLGTIIWPSMIYYWTYWALPLSSWVLLLR